VAGGGDILGDLDCAGYVLEKWQIRD